MGDGGVACMSLQHNVMERFPIQEKKTALCGTSNNNANATNNGLASSKPVKKKKKKVKVKVKSTAKRAGTSAEVPDALSGEPEKKAGKEAENGGEPEKKEEVEEGELGTLKESENGELVLEGIRRSEPEVGEFVPAKWRREFEKNESRRGNFDFAPPWRGGHRDDIEKGEFIPDRWQRDDHGYGKIRRYDPSKSRSWKWERDPTGQQPPPPPGDDGRFRRKEFNRVGIQHVYPRWERESGLERSGPRISSKIVDEEGCSFNKDFSGKSYGVRTKRYGADPDVNERKHYSGEHADYAPGPKSRRISVERPYYRVPSSSRLGPPDNNNNSNNSKYSGRNYDSAMSSRVDRNRYYDHRDRSPVRRERSPYVRERSPYDRNRPYDHKNRSQSPMERVATRHRDRTPGYLDRSPHDRSRSNNQHRDTVRKSGPSEKRSKGQEEQAAETKEAVVKEELPDKSSGAASCEIISKEVEIQSPGGKGTCSREDEPLALVEELPSMEEDMDICDTPPHATVVSNLSTGKWFYLDYYGLERGPSKLCDLKVLVEEGSLFSDHLVKHLESDRWMTVENAVSPLVTMNFPSIIIPDSVTQLVSPPEAPGNLLVDAGDLGQYGNRTTNEKPLQDPELSEVGFEPLDDLCIDQRIDTLLEGTAIAPGKELEALGEILQFNFDYALWENWEKSEGLALHPCQINEQEGEINDEASRHSDAVLPEGGESWTKDKEHDNWFSGKWTCTGGDWKINDEDMALDRPARKKLVLNDGFPLCEMPKSGNDDPRWHHKDDLYCRSQGKRLDLPHWAFSTAQDEKSDSGGSASRPAAQTKLPIVRGVKGTTLPVIRINACVVKDHGSFFSESRMKVRAKERHSSKTPQSYSATSSDGRRSSVEDETHSKAINQGPWKHAGPINMPKDRICTIDDLRLFSGEWYYLDGAGHEQGPLSFSEIQALANMGVILRQSCVFRKFDRVWIPITAAPDNSKQTVKSQPESVMVAGDSSAPLSLSEGTAFAVPNAVPSSFNNLHPQFIGYTLGKLHELVMKSYKTREFAAALNDVLDPWMNAKQPKKEIEKHIFWKTEVDARGTKRARLMVEDSEEDMEDEQMAVKADSTFEELCGEAVFCREETLNFEHEIGCWGSLDGQVLAQVFHFLRADLKSLVFASLTCKHWRSAVRFYRNISRQIDFSSLGPECTDLTILNTTMSGYNKNKIRSIILIGCTNVTSNSLGEILCSSPLLSTVDIRGCSQFNELSQKHIHIHWIKRRSSRNFEESQSKVRSLKHITERSSSTSRVKGLYDDMDDFGELKEYFNSVNKRDSANQSFRGSLYKRSKLFDARKSSSILSRDARTRRWAIKKSENGYRRMEEFLASSLKDIMKENTFDFFVPKVTEIQEKMKKGYYIGRGLSSVKEDISRMCRDAIKAKKRGDVGNMNHIVTLFIQLATRLEEGSKVSNDKDVSKLYEDDSSTGFSSTSKYKKKLNKVGVTERKYRSNGASSLNGSFDYGEDASDQEIRRRLSKLNKRSFDSGSDTSDDPDRSFEDSKSVSESTVSDTESEKSESRIWKLKCNGDIITDESFDSMADDREWGARMTKASLVPPVTRKYEVIDHYVIVADEDEVKHKMQVSLPEDYAEKFHAQKNGTEEADMELPEVKDFKPRKQLGSEVLEQEVYGIDPYTHNLLLDSMPNEMDWPLADKHVFIEDVLLRTLNKKVRQFTGSGTTPMVYTLRPVIEEIKDLAEDNGDFRTVKMCQSLLLAVDSRADDKYVAYRKGLGVVCNKDCGFGEDDFIVEFLGEVYPVWKWFEKQDGIRSLQKNSDDPAPEFYNIYLERPKGDADGYDLVVVDAMHKANYASRICHSCRPNCEAKVTAVDGHYQIGIYSLRKIANGEEITFDYNSVTESKEEYEASVCLCGSQVCRGSYLNLTGEGAFQKVLKDFHGVLNRHHLMIEACETNLVSEDDYLVLGRAGLGSCLLGGLPDWLIAYSAHLVRFINFERTKLPDEILKHNLEEKRKYFSDICLEVETSDAELQAEGVYNQRLQNLAVTLDKVRYVLRCVFGDPKTAPPPLERLSHEAAISFLWKGEGSLIEELLESLVPHLDEKLLDDLRSKISAHDPSDSEDAQKELKKSLLWLRDELRDLPCTYKSRNDAAADLIHIYAHTKNFFRIREYKAVTSPAVYISPLDLGPKCKDKLGPGLQEYSKTYGENYCLGQLIFWHNQTNADPDSSLARVSRGCLSLPELGSFYAKIHKPTSRQRVYGPKIVHVMLSRMEKLTQKPWPKDAIWSFKSSPKLIGSPMLDAVLSKGALDKEMVHWLKHRHSVYQGMWDR